jgi:two-component system cell cycle sensor histidine kinase/response regulator CckA
MFEMAPMGIALAEPATRRLLRVNERLCAITGYAADELVDRCLGDLTHPDDRERGERLFELFARGELTDARIKERCVRRDGDVVWIDLHVTAVPDAPGRPARALVTVVDITERERTQSALREASERYRTLVDNLEDVVFSTDLAGRVTFVNRAVEHFGYRAEDVVGRACDEFIHPDDLPTLRGRHRGPPRPPGMVEHRILDAAGKVRTVRSATRPLVVEGQVVGATGLLEDLTAQRETEEQLRAAQRMEAVGRLAGGVAHDFNNLLTVILSYTQFVMAELGSDPLRDELAEVESAARRAEALTRQLLAFSRRQVLRPEPVAVGDLVGGLSKMLERLIGEDVDLSVSSAGRPFDVLADRGQLEQVVMNLVVNARDAMPDGGRVAIRTANVELDRARAEALQLAAGPYVELSVSDTGHGMDAATRARIFEPFFTTKPVGRGTGLGLSMVYGLVKQSGGAVGVESEPGRGTTFRVYLPPHRAARARRSEPPCPDAGHGSETILLVEDESALRLAACRMLCSAGYDVVAAADAHEALRAFDRHASRIRLVITDVVMPGMSGKELASHIATRCPSMRVLFTSGYADDTLAHHGVLGPDFLPKPYETRTLTTVVRRVLDAR